MPRQIRMAVAFLLPFAAVVHCSNSVVMRNQACAPSHEMACFTPDKDLSSSNPIDINLCAGTKLTISLEHMSQYPLCHWMRGAELVQTANKSQSMILPPLTEKNSGKYTLRCETRNKNAYSVTVSLHIATKNSIKPRLILEHLENPLRSPYFTCISGGCPIPTLKWSGNKKGEISHSNSGWSNITISSVTFPDGAMCCATNTEGQECSQLYDYDLDTDVMKNDEVSTIIVSPNESLLLRCKIQAFFDPFPVWKKGGKAGNDITLQCTSTVKEICVRTDSHKSSIMTYLLIKSVKEQHSGIYTCKSPENKTKSVHIDVRAKGFLSIQLDESKIIPAQNVSSSCLEARVSYNSVIQNCVWETPDNARIKCIVEDWVTNNRTVKLCHPIKSGDYKLHLDAGGLNETKAISVCVVDPPEFKFRNNKVNNTFIFETASLVPANYTWMSCPSANESCETDSSWSEIPSAFQTDPDILCYKAIESSLSRELVEGHHFRFCLTNSVGTWCNTMFAIYEPPLPLALKGPSNDDSGNFKVLKVCSVLLLLALAVVCIVLVYFIKKKGPQYQPQLQMIQMVGPNDNDYIYINFKNLQYDSKWEFPRENLELGKELGSGAFGMVVQATAYGINKPGVSQQVAVKMLKEKHQTVEKEALMSELKMLTHIGHHANIVNLLGACTESGPTYLIFQYCCYGDLLNYLKKNRERYHKSVTDAFNKDRFSSLYHNVQTGKNTSNLERSQGDYVPMHCSPTRGQEDISLLTLTSGDSFEGLEMDGSIDDETEDLQTLTFDDLLSFAYQVAKGMEFLSLKNCIHRDLAARNVLVTKGRLVKIGDFGLARDIDNDSNYVVRGNVRLPVKWMAPESTFQGIYTMKSDVWAYGILLWEIFSLGVTPYPGIKVDHKFYSMIESGFKMECPYYSNESVYEIMSKCWALKPSDRPSFSELVFFMCDQLTDREEKLYHNMLDQTTGDYQNTSVIMEISLLAEQNENKVANEYSPTHLAVQSKEDISDLEAVSTEEKLLKPCDKQ